MRKMIIVNKKEPCRAKHKAQGMVEFALVLPILLLLVFGIIEFGRLLFLYASVTSASREAARYGAAVGDIGGGTLRYQDCDGIVAAASRIGVLAGITDADVIIQYDDGTSIKFNSCQDVQDVFGAPIYLGDRIIVTVTRLFQPIVPLVNIPAIPISATTARTIIRDVSVKGTPMPTSTKWPTMTPSATLEDPPSPTATKKKDPTFTPTSTNTPTGSPTPTNTLPPPTPACQPADFDIEDPLQADGNSIYLSISNISTSPLTITGIELDWPYGERGDDLFLTEVRFAVDTDILQPCSATGCLWNGTPVYTTTMTICETGCDEEFIVGANRVLEGGKEQELRFVFSDDLLSSLNDSYNPNPYPYNVRLYLDNSCYVETLKTHYIHPE